MATPDPGNRPTADPAERLRAAVGNVTAANEAVRAAAARLEAERQPPPAPVDEEELP